VAAAAKAEAAAAAADDPGLAPPERQIIRRPARLPLRDSNHRNVGGPPAGVRLPLFVPLETALEAGLEHRENTWKHLFALPIHRWATTPRSCWLPPACWC